MLSITAPIAPSRTSTPALPTGPAPNQNGFIFNSTSLTVRVLLAPRCQSAQTGCAQHTSTRHHSTACWPCQTLRIAIHRRKGTTLKFLFIVVPFLFGGSFILFKDREGILPAIVAVGAHALLAFITSCVYRRPHPS